MEARPVRVAIASSMPVVSVPVPLLLGGGMISGPTTSRNTNANAISHSVLFSSSSRKRYNIQEKQILRVWLSGHTNGSITISSSSRSRVAATDKKATQKIKEDEDEEEEEEEKAMSSKALNEFIQLNEGRWTGSFYQFDALGNQLQCIGTELTVTSYGEDNLASLMQTLKIKQAPSKTTILESTAPEWEEFKLRETNMLTVEKHQQIGFFPEEKAFSLRHQTAAILDRVLRVGVLGEDDVDEEFPNNLKAPTRRPSIVCESCLYSSNGSNRFRAFHVMNQQGLIDMIGLFHETKEIAGNSVSTLVKDKEPEERIKPLLGRWTGHSVTRRSGFYGATVAEADTYLTLEMNDKGQLIQDINQSGREGGNLQWTGTLEGAIVVFNGGFQMMLLPGGMYLTCPTNIAKSVAETVSFCLEFAWMETQGLRRRLVRTIDVNGLVVSTTLVTESRL